MIHHAAALFAVSAIFSLSLLPGKLAVADHSGIIIQTDPLMMQGKRKQPDTSQQTGKPDRDQKKIIVTEKIFFTGKRK